MTDPTVTYDHGVRVTKLQLSLHRNGHLIRGRVIVAAWSTTGRAVTRTLRVGGCLRGAMAAPICPASTSITVDVPATGSVSIMRPITLRQPGARLDSVEARLVVPGAATEAAFHHADAELLIRGRAWRGITAGHQYGVVLTSSPEAAVGRISVDGPATRRDELYADVVYTATGSALGQPETTFTRSPPPAGDVGTVLRNRRGSGPESFRDRFDVEHPRFAPPMVPRPGWVASLACEPPSSWTCTFRTSTTRASGPRRSSTRSSRSRSRRSRRASPR